MIYVSKLPRQSNCDNGLERDKVQAATQVSHYRDRQATRYTFIYV